MIRESEIMFIYEGQNVKRKKDNYDMNTYKVVTDGEDIWYLTRKDFRGKLYSTKMRKNNLTNLLNKHFVEIKEVKYSEV